MKAGALFDLDGTLIRGTSAERLLVPWLVRQGVIGARQLAAAALLAAGWPLVGRTRALRRNKRWLTGVEVEAVRSRMDAFIDQVVAPRWHGPALARLEELRGEGVVPFLVSGAPDFIVAAVGERLGVGGFVATPMEVRDGRFTGRISGTHCFAEAKLDAVRALAREHDLDLGACWGFADHRSDVPFLGGVGHPVVVDPAGHLLRLAREAGWGVLRQR